MPLPLLLGPRILLMLPLHFLPLVVHALEPQRRKAYARRLHDPRRIFLLVRLLLRHLALAHSLVPFMRRPEGIVDLFAGMERGDGGEPRGEDLLALHAPDLLVVFAGGDLFDVGGSAGVGVSRVSCS